ncbi:GH25 family lysozyme [Limosilactobacillus reuteri]|nr:GH25 family lysozyme [Limosilactobacillus reuteri]MDC6076575.1 GH25 family lysozyme [Limosilactobacillus reuteri]
MISGIDVSEWQGHVDFNAVKASGVKFVLIRAGYGRSASQEDRYFAEHYTQAKAAGLQVVPTGIPMPFLPLMQPMKPGPV